MPKSFDKALPSFGFMRQIADRSAMALSEGACHQKTNLLQQKKRAAAATYCRFAAALCLSCEELAVMGWLRKTWQISLLCLDFCR
jgi:hypothetical protein